MERSLIKEVNKKNMAARFSSKAVTPVYFPNFFGIKPVTSLKWETLTTETGVPVMADVIAYDATAPIKTREVVNKMSGDIPKIAIKRGMNESDWNEYQRLLAFVNGQSDLKAILDHVFADFDFCYNGVRSRMEYLAIQAASKGEISLSKTNNAGIVTETAINFGVPTANKSGVSVSWATSATAKPLEDIEGKVAAAESNGRSIRYVIMRKGDFNDLKNATDTVNKIKAWVNTKGSLVVTLDTINEFMEANQLPKIIVVNPSVRFEDASNTRTVVNPWENHRVLFAQDIQVGQIQHGPIAAESSAEVQKIATMAKKDFVLVTKWATHEPFAEWTKAEANAFPVLNDPDSLYYLDVEHTGWGANL